MLDEKEEQVQQNSGLQARSRHQALEVIGEIGVEAGTRNRATGRVHGLGRARDERHLSTPQSAVVAAGIRITEPQP
jgi:hypothetical protein